MQCPAAPSRAGSPPRRAAPKPIAITGGTGTYRNAGGEGVLVEFADQTGTLDLRVLAFPARGGR
jgi:hypothetical protein